jgi:outer membrane protein OmpA-like peptidoglycan-associated protein
MLHQSLAGRVVAAALFFASLGGCGFVPRTQYSACETQAKILNEQNKAQLAEIANLKAHSRKLEDQLLQADKELSGLSKRAEADQKRLSNFQVERERVQEELDGLVRGAKLTGITPVRDDDVERLTKRFPMLRFDPVSGAYKLDSDVLFNADGSRIAPESEKLLAEFAAMFAEPEARELRVMVVGRAATASTSNSVTAAQTAVRQRVGAERALAVAEFLRKVGLGDDRIGVSGVVGEATADGSPEAQKRQRRVEIFVMGKRTPVVGWDAGINSRF